MQEAWLSYGGSFTHQRASCQQLHMVNGEGFKFEGSFTNLK